MAIENKIREIYEEISNLKEILGEGEYIYCFRGESADYGATKLTPTLFRNKVTEGGLPDRELINLIADYQISDPGITSNLARAIEGQHFIALSRLLDITFSIIPALYFACSDNEEKNGYVYIFRFPRAFSPSSTYINTFYDKMISRQITPYANNFKVLAHMQSNERIKSQSGGFILFPGDEAIRIPDIYYSKVEIRESEKKEILNELDLFFGMNESVVYPQKDKKRDVIIKKLSMISEEVNCFEFEKAFYSIEIEEALERIRFEIIVLLKKGNKRKDLLRVLRKEKHELFDYLLKLLNFDSDFDFRKYEKIVDYRLEKLENYLIAYKK